MNNKKLRKVTTFGKQADIEFGKNKISKRKVFESEIESFGLGTVIQEARKFRQLTQQALALRSGTTKSYISRIENNGSDIRFSTLMKIIHDGLGAKLNFAAEIKTYIFKEYRKRT